MDSDSPSTSNLFNSNEFEALANEQEREEFLINSLELFLAKYDRKSRRSISSITSEDEIAINHFSNHIQELFKNKFDDVFDRVTKFIPLIYLYRKSVPNPVDYITYIQKSLFIMIREGKAIDQSAINTLFSDTKFCQSYIKANSLKVVVNEIMMSGKYMEAEKILNCIFTDVFVTEISTQTYTSLPDMLTDIFKLVFKKQLPEMKSLLFNLMQFIASIFLKQPGIYDALSLAKFFELLNENLLQNTFQDFWDVYSILLYAGNQVSIIVLDKLNQFDKSSSTPIEWKHNLLQKILSEDKILTVLNTIEWFYDDVVRNIQTFNIFTAIIDKMITFRFDAFPITGFFTSLTPPLRKGFLYNIGFGYMDKMLDIIGIDNFVPEAFYQIFLYSQDIESIGAYFQIEEFYRLFYHVYVMLDVGQQTPKLLQIIVDLIQSEKVGIKEDLISMMKKNVQPETLNFFLSNIEKPLYCKYLAAIVNPSIVPYYIKAIDLESIVLTKVENPDFMKKFLTYVVFVVNQTKSHFFDKWVNTLPADSLLFKVDSALIKEVTMKNANVIPIPSLFPLMITADFAVSEYNNYLIGKYGIPIYRKLGIPLFQVPHIHDILSRFCRDEEVLNLLKNDFDFATTLFSTGVADTISCYEFGTNDIAWIDTNQSFTGIVFFIKFPSPSSSPCNFISFNNNNTLYYQNTNIFIGNKVICPVQPLKWYQIGIINTKMRKTEIFIDGKQIHSIKDNFKFLMFGSDKERMPISFLISSNILAASNIMPDVLKKHQLNMMFDPPIQFVPHKSCNHVPSFSLKTVMIHHCMYEYVIDLFETTTDERRFLLLQKLLHYIAKQMDDSVVDQFFKRYLFSIERCSKALSNIAYITEYIDTIFDLYSEESRTRQLMNFLMNWVMWQEFNSTIPAVVFEKLNSKILDKSINAEWLCENNLWEVLSFLVIFFPTTEFLAQMHKFIDICITKLPKPDLMLKGLVDISQFLNMWSFFHKVTDPDYFTDVLSSFTTKSSSQLFFIRIMFTLQRNMKIELLSTESILYTSIYLDEGVASVIFRSLFETSSDQTLATYQPIIYKIIQRFPNDMKIFNKIISLVIQRPFNINDPKQKLKIKKACFVPYLLAFAMGITKIQFNDNCQYVYSSISLILKNQYSTLMDPNNLPYFIDFLRGGESNIPRIQFEIAEIFKNTDMNKQVLKDLTTEVQRGMDKFYDSLEFLNKTFTVQYTENYVQFATTMIYLMLENLLGSNKEFKRLTLFIITNANTKIIQMCFKSFITTHRKTEIEINSLKHLYTALHFCFIYHKQIYKNSGLIFSLIQFCSDNFQRLSMFIGLLISLIDQMESMEINLFLDVLLQQINTQLMMTQQVAIQFVAMILNAKIPFDHKFFSIYYPMLVSVVTPRPEEINFPSLIRTHKSFVELSGLQEKYAFIYQTQQEMEEENKAWKAKYDLFYTEYSIQRKDLDFLSNFMFQNAIKNAIKCATMQNKFNHKLNKSFRDHERMIVSVHKNRINYETPKVQSYRVSVFSPPAICPTVVVPSQYKIIYPQDQATELKKNDVKLLMIQPIMTFNHPVTSEYPQDLFAYSSLFGTKGTSLLSHFTMNFPDYDSKINATLIRYDLKIKCVVFRYGKGYKILMNAMIENDQLNLLETTNHCMIESFLMDEFGKYTVFCGHFIIILNEDDVLLIRNYVYAAINTCYLFITLSAGTFILMFDKENVMQTSPSNLNIQFFTDKWISHQISNYDYLLAVNYFSNRSFVDMTAYPVLPRVNNDLKMRDPPEWRDMAVPIDLIVDKEAKEKTMSTKIFALQFHHNENISNPLNVSSLLSRLVPFCQIQWDMNDTDSGWDAGDRNFNSVQVTMSVTRKTSYEFPPEFYSFPEVLLNLNKFALDDGKPFDLMLPEWANNMFEFLENHRAMFEHNNVRATLNQWIDLIFGVNQRGEGAKEKYNLFNPLSYYDPNLEEHQSQHDWMIICGQVPFQIFNKPHPVSEPMTPFSEIRITFAINPKIDRSKPYEIFKMQNKLVYNQSLVYRFAPLYETIHSDSTEHFISVTTDLSSVYVFRIIPDLKIIPLAFFHRYAAKFTIINERQYICATACTEELVIWSFISGRIISDIKIRGVSCLIFDDILNCIFFSSGTILYQYSLNGFFIRKYELPVKITCIQTVGFGYSFSNRLIVIGLQSGVVKLLKIDDNSNEFKLYREKKMSAYPINAINVIDNRTKIEVFDLRFDYPHLFTKNSH